MFRWVVGLSLAVLLCCVASDSSWPPENTSTINTASLKKQSSRHPQAPGVANPARALRRKMLTDGATPARSSGAGLVRHPLHHVPGADGRGTTEFAKTLPHQPADLMHHFHLHPGDGDAYLFWRVSQGGTVEPFKSAVPSCRLSTRC